MIKECVIVSRSTPGGRGVDPRIWCVHVFAPDSRRPTLGMPKHKCRLCPGHNGLFQSIQHKHRYLYDMEICPFSGSFYQRDQLAFHTHCVNLVMWLNSDFRGYNFTILVFLISSPVRPKYLLLAKLQSRYPTTHTSMASMYLLTSRSISCPKVGKFCLARMRR